jgi:hypothetical protein
MRPNVYALTMETEGVGAIPNKGGAQNHHNYHRVRRRGEPPELTGGGCSRDQTSPLPWLQHGELARRLEPGRYSKPGGTKTTIARKAWEATASRAAVATLDPLPAAAVGLVAMHYCWVQIPKDCLSASALSVSLTSNKKYMRIRKWNIVWSEWYVT